MQKSSLPKLSARLKVLKMLEMPNDDISVKENLNIFPHSSKSANFLPYSHERDSIGRLISVFFF